MSELIKIENGRATVSSLEIAERFRKRHDNIIRDIESLIQNNKDFGLLNFEEIFYKDSYERSQKCYSITRDGFALLAMGFTGQKAIEWKIKYINAFNQMEETLRKVQSGSISKSDMIKSRKQNTDIFKEHGFTKPCHYINATKRQTEIVTGKTPGQIKQERNPKARTARELFTERERTGMILEETLTRLNILDYSPSNYIGVMGCIEKTAPEIDRIFHKKPIEINT